MPDDAVLDVRLPGRPEAASAARRALAALNGDLHLISEARLRDARLLLSELVSNAVRAGGGEPVHLCVRASATVLRVEVANSGGAFDPAGVPAPSSERAGGWGLRIVDALAHRWGVAAEADGVRVWFEVHRPRASTPLALSDDAPPPARLAPETPSAPTAPAPTTSPTALDAAGTALDAGNPGGRPTGTATRHERSRGPIEARSSSMTSRRCAG
jgi:anti-sigma regulatory factor (Ser/Thr protein kinase)